MRNEDGSTQGQLLYFRDITYEAEVDAMKSEFLSIAAHELRTPLASIYGFSELLLHRQYDEKVSHEMVETIHRQSLNLKHLLDELLDLSRIEVRAGKDFYMKSGSLEKLVQQSISEIKDAHDGRQLSCETPESWPLVSFDAEKMHQVFNNLLSNAFKYSPDGGEIEVSTCHRTKAEKEEFGVSIRDHGIGMTTQQLARVGERFYRADASGAISGTGLGIALVNEILEIHGGELEIVSDMGVGTTVTVWLPIDSHFLLKEKKL